MNSITYFDLCLICWNCRKVYSKIWSLWQSQERLPGKKNKQINKWGTIMWIRCNMLWKNAHQWFKPGSHNLVAKEAKPFVSYKVKVINSFLYKSCKNHIYLKQMYADGSICNDQTVEFTGNTYYNILHQGYSNMSRSDSISIIQ